MPQSGGVVKLFEIKKRIEISAAHKLKLSYESKCAGLHGHNWVVDIYLKSETLNTDGMIMDFDRIRDKLMEKLDHKVLNDVLDFNPTAELLAKYICDFFAPFCYRVEVQECADNTASYYKQ